VQGVSFQALRLQPLVVDQPEEVKQPTEVSGLAAEASGITELQENDDYISTQVRDYLAEPSFIFRIIFRNAHVLKRETILKALCLTRGGRDDAEAKEELCRQVISMTKAA
jgi:hypothetical protein